MIDYIVQVLFDKRSIEILGDCLTLLRPVLLLAPSDYLDELRVRLDAAGVANAVRDRDSIALFDWIVRLLARQGIANHAAETFLTKNGSATFAMITAEMAKDAYCPRLRGYWTFESCGYRRVAYTCANPHQRIGCPVTLLPARKGALAEAAVGVWLLLRDICDGDIVGWIDQRLGAADPGRSDAYRAQAMQQALLKPLTEISGTGLKVWSMILSELLLGADQNRERWMTTGAGFIAIDTLVHNFLDRTGILRRLDANHAYGPKCYAAGGCVDVIRELATCIDAREFNPEYPTCFPRWVQFSIWCFCAADGWNTCNANKVDDRVGCEQAFCPVYPSCDRLAFSAENPC